MTAQSIKPETEPAIIAGATGLLQALWTAQLRGLPMPFAIRGYETRESEMQVHTYDEVATWAEALGVDVVERAGCSIAKGVLLDVEVTVVAAQVSS